MISNLQLNDILIDQSKGFVYIVLNRPDALNALTLEMTRVLFVILQKAAQDSSVKGVFISGEGDRAFCAGGDLKSLYREGMSFRRGEAQENLASIFFEDEYNLNAQIWNFEKPYVAFLNGITMGGGYGVSAHGSHIVATKDTLFAMPEVKIGFFPDVGAIYNLSRLKNFIGLYLALTGSTIDAPEMYYSGLCDAIISRDDITRVQSKIADAIDNNGDADFETQKKIISEMLAKNHVSPNKVGVIEGNIKHIEKCFSKGSVPEIIEAVKSVDNEWGRNTLEALEFACPFSLLVTFEHYHRAKTMDFGEVIAQDYILATHFIMGHDLYEGIKSAVMDKSKNPTWSPADLSEISKEDVINYFLPVNLL